MLDLSRCAAMCYRRGGRRRNAALLRMEGAEALAAAGATREAVSLMAALVQEVLLEGWLSVGVALLLRLLECSQPLAAVRSSKPPAYRCLDEVLDTYRTYCIITSKFFF